MSYTMPKLVTNSSISSILSYLLSICLNRRSKKRSACVSLTLMLASEVSGLESSTTRPPESQFSSDGFGADVTAGYCFATLRS